MAVSDSYTVDEDAVLTLAASVGVLVNDSDPDGDAEGGQAGTQSAGAQTQGADSQHVADAQPEPGERCGDRAHRATPSRETTSEGVAIDAKHIQAKILSENGGTVVIGGIFEMEETDQENKIPLLGDVPVVGNLFKSRTKTADKREMLVFITPKVISDRGPVR